MFLIPESLASDVSVGRRYFLAGGDALLDKTQFGRLSSIIETMDGDIRTLPVEWGCVRSEGSNCEV